MLWEMLYPSMPRREHRWGTEGTAVTISWVLKLHHYLASPGTRLQCYPRFSVKLLSIQMSVRERGWNEISGEKISGFLMPRQV